MRGCLALAAKTICKYSWMQVFAREKAVIGEYRIYRSTGTGETIDFFLQTYHSARVKTILTSGTFSKPIKDRKTSATQ